MNDTNDMVAFVTRGEENTIKNKTKEIECMKWKKIVVYSWKTVKMYNKKVSSFLVQKDDVIYSSSVDDEPVWQKMWARYGDLEVVIEMDYDENDCKDTEDQCEDDDEDEDIKHSK